MIDLMFNFVKTYSMVVWGMLKAAVKENHVLVVSLQSRVKIKFVNYTQRSCDCSKT